MKKRIVSLLLALILVIGMIPLAASATEPETVYISISDDAYFATDPDGFPMGFFAVTLDELASIDLNVYGLGDYTYDADGDGMPEIVALHLYIYVHEVILGLDWSEVYVTGAPGSIYFAGGLFGFFDENLRYDLNGAYPAIDGWGLTADRIVLSDGDFINVAHYTDWAFWGDSATGFHYFTDAEGNLQHAYELEVGESLELGLVRSYSDWSNGGVPAFAPEVEYAVYYGVTYGEPYGRVYTDEDGILEIEFPEDDGFMDEEFPATGTWYVWTDGGYGMENPEAIVSAPAFATVNIKGEPDLHFTLDLTGLEDPIYEGGIVITNLANPNEFACLDDTAEAGNKMEFAFRAEEYDNYIIYVDFYSDSLVVGWNVNGTNYLIEDSADNDNYWDFGNDSGVGYGFGYTDEVTGRQYDEFYLVLGLEEAYHNPGSWVIKPLILTDEIIEVIDAIGYIEEVTLESGDDINDAWELYNALSDADKELVFNYEDLVAAQAVYDALLDDQTAANEVAAKITAIGEVSLDKESLIAEARVAYDGLNDTRKALVANYATLTAAEERFQQLKAAAAQAAADQAAADAVEEQITAIGTVTVFSGKKIDAARAAFDALTDGQKTLVENVNQLTAAESVLTEGYKQAATADHKAIYEATGKYIAGLGTPYVGSTGGEWMVIALTRGGYPCPEGYYKNVVEFVKAEINDKEQLHRVKSTENSRVILGLTAAGYDVTNVDGHNLLMGLTDMTYLPKQGINGPIWALIAFDSHDYEIPANPNASEQVTREKLIAYILEKQLSDGGWALSGQTADPDMTGMAIQALAPYYKTNDAVKTAVDKALTCLSNKQMANGGFGSIDGVCTESCTQVVVALTALGIDPETDSRFVKNGISVLDAMCLFAVEDGGFAHIPDQGINGMATEQGQYALAAYFRFKEGKTALYDMKDVMIRDNNTGAGKVENTTDEKENAHTGALDIPEEVLADKLLTEEEEKLVESGVNITIALAVEDISKKVSAEDKTLVEKSLGKNTVGLYLDITLTKQLGDAAPVKITETNGAVTVTVVVPENLRNTDAKVDRTYKVVRVHEGKTDILDAVYDAKTGKLSFQTDCFSTYALVYTDTAVAAAPQTPQTPQAPASPQTPQSPEPPQTSQPPQTGDNTNLMLLVSMMVVSLLGMATLVFIPKKKIS